MVILKLIKNSEEDLTSIEIANKLQWPLLCVIGILKYLDHNNLIKNVGTRQRKIDGVFYYKWNSV